MGADSPFRPMRIPATLPIASLLAVAAPALAQNFILDDSAPYAPNSYRHTNDYAVGEVSFNNGTGKGGSDPYSVDPVSLKETFVTLDNSTEVRVYDVCFEMFVGPTGSSSYNVTEGFGTMNASQESATRALFSNALNDFIFARDNLGFTAAAEVGAAIQMALWEIVEDTDPVLSLDEGSADAGILSVDIAGSASGSTASAIALAGTYLGNIQSGTWTDQGGFNYYYADAGSEQDRLWITTTPIPEPSAALTALLGLAFAFRRRR